jgi:hypothetical protein
MTLERVELHFAAPSVILVPALVAHAFHFKPDVTNGWVITLTEDVVATLTAAARAAPSRLSAFSEHPILPISDEAESTRLSNLCAELLKEYSLAREGYQLMMRGLLTFVVGSIVRLGTDRVPHPLCVFSRARGRRHHGAAAGRGRASAQQRGGCGSTARSRERGSFASDHALRVFSRA